jgi:hypothetical protein
LLLLTGHIVTTTSGEPVIGASVFAEDLKQGTVTDQLRKLFISPFPEEDTRLRIASLGMKGTHRMVLVYSNGKLDIELNEDVRAAERSGC